MSKYKHILYGCLAGIGVKVLFEIIDMPDFLVGWFSCMAFAIVSGFGFVKVEQ